MTRPLTGCRVLDLGIITAGAATAACLADFGAEVIKIESASYRDPFRRWLSPKPIDAADDLPPFFRATNRNKKGLSLDLKQAAGRAAFLRLVANSDVVVENFRRGVMQKLGIDYAALKEANPDIILASISSQGETGPDAMYVSYGSTLEAVAGLSWITGYQGGDPVITGVDMNYPDQVVGLFATSMIVTAWLARKNGKGGAHLDMSQRELTSFLSGEAFVAASAGVSPARQGNADTPFLLQDCYRAADGEWLAVTVNDDQQARLASLLNDLPGSASASASASASTLQLDASLRKWSAARKAVDAAAALQQAGIAAAKVLNGAEVLQGEGKLWRHALQRLPAGNMVKGFPHQFEQAAMEITTDAPFIGGDTVDVLRQVGGFSQEEIAALLAQGVIEIAPPAPSSSAAPAALT
ncbi:CaiB/BaiF CoA-transferase family protein [Herbaspirillum lusitanum]|uniref:CaiB/BaiF CoA-transferase family protein n=1 Tax=Herbaspirillum lusitanum TaxID=213312 RepID=A0ABW9AE90_9BURK